MKLKEQAAQELGSEPLRDTYETPQIDTLSGQAAVDYVSPRSGFRRDQE